MKAKISALLAGMILLAGCTDHFEEMNTDPNSVTNAMPEALLSPGIYEFVSYNLGRSKAINNELMQVTVTANNNNDIHRYDITSTYSDSPWNNWYTKLNVFRKMYTIAEQLDREAYMGIARILDCWGTSIVTDAFGDVPDTEACKGDQGVFQPSFDKQKDIYERMFMKLDSANVWLARAEALTTDQQDLDLLYHGDLSSWRKFGNSLYLRLLLRLSKRTGEVEVIEKMREILADPSLYPVFQKNDDSAILRFTGSNPLLSPFHNNTNYDFSGNSGLSEFFINTLMDWGDPRLKIWASEATLGAYWGIQSGYLPGNAPDIGSKLQYDLRQNPLLGNMMNYAELEFIKAEIALRGWMDETDPSESYYKGVKAAIDLWVPGLTDATFYEDYLQQEGIAWQEDEDPEVHLQKILTQKYFTLFFTDLQQWFEYRRTGYPELVIGPGVKNDGKMPSRLRYPVYIQNLNRENYQLAVASMGGDRINTVMWWDK